jgi:hypothetical protein
LEGDHQEEEVKNHYTAEELNPEFINQEDGN